MKLSQIFEYASSNPFVGVVSSLDLRIKQVEVATHSSDHSSVFTTSLHRQLNDLLKFLDSSSKWVIPASKLKTEFHSALPEIKRNVVAAQRSIGSNVKAALGHLMVARDIAVKRSHLKFGGIE